MYTSVSQIFGFSEPSGDPYRHAEWAREQMPRVQEALERIKEHWAAKQALRARRRDPG